MNRGMLAALLLALGACSSRDVVIVYSPHGTDVLRDYEQLFEAAYPEVDLQGLDMGSQEVYNRIRSERNRPACDVWWGAPSTMFMQAAKDGLLEPYRPTWADAIDPDEHDRNDLWYGIYRTPLAIMFNNRGNTRETVPHGWDELLAPEWKGKITIRQPLPSGTMRTFIGAIIMREGGEKAGLKWLKKLDESTKSYVESPQLLFDHLKRNEELITVWIMPDAVYQRDRYGFPFDYVLPRPTPVLTEGVAIVKDAPHREWAAKFYEFVTTKDAFAHQAEAYSKIPARTDIDPEMLPAWMVEQPIEPMHIDWESFAANENRWAQFWEREVYHAR